MISVRRASIDDLEPLTAAYTAAWRKGFQEMFSAAVFMQDRFDEQRAAECRSALLDDTIDVQVAELDGHVVGFLGVRELGGVSDIVELWVHPHAWGSGAAQALLATIEDQHRNVGRTNLATWLPEDSPRARRLFEKASWRPTGEVGQLDAYPGEANRTFHYTRTLV
jgi:GNAT superfamily N-acetyltransferase